MIRSAAITAIVLLTACTTPLPPEPADPTPVPPPHPTPNAACGAGEPPPAAPVYAFYTCAGADPESDPQPVARTAQAADPVTLLESAMIGLLGGPTEAEREAGYSSFFSAETQLALNGISLEPDGTALVDLADIRFLNNASTSAGSRALIAQLNATVFQFEEISGVEYRIDGSCAAFWEWLQGTCHVEERAR